MWIFLRRMNTIHREVCMIKVNTEEQNKTVIYLYIHIEVFTVQIYRTQPIRYGGNLWESQFCLAT